MHLKQELTFFYTIVVSEQFTKEFVHIKEWMFENLFKTAIFKNRVERLLLELVFNIFDYFLKFYHRWKLKIKKQLGKEPKTGEK